MLKKINYPMWIYHEHKMPEGIIVRSVEQENSLGEGWVDTPAKFGQKANDVKKAEPKEVVSNKSGISLGSNR